MELIVGNIIIEEKSTNGDTSRVYSVAKIDSLHEKVGVRVEIVLALIGAD